MGEEDLYELVMKAQRGDKKALRQLIGRFHPLIKKVSKERKSQEREDVEQETVELVIKTILAYDLSRTPDYSKFCSLVYARLDDKS
ncbi:hypothetical protein J31TS4_38300 [Paenibacillus sp. J31TS4]|uniref:helix-turn-helix domain-containing protein n=1 Tax=Paenibacillus sp. J31TS4 TaxID=2807195 RepID=UPI001B251AC8|nr:helix-turn-helix domain-containing protein [Paenibacillus sp. J31TS4]GIP40550.1 hypothetical protein J31TS4_38300 [Paenibacillus sp. J31TS4]